MSFIGSAISAVGGVVGSIFGGVANAVGEAVVDVGHVAQAVVEVPVHLVKHAGETISSLGNGNDHNNNHSNDGPYTPSPLAVDPGTQPGAGHGPAISPAPTPIMDHGPGPAADQNDGMIYHSGDHMM